MGDVSPSVAVLVLPGGRLDGGLAHLNNPGHFFLGEIGAKREKGLVDA